MQKTFRKFATLCIALLLAVNTLSSLAFAAEEPIVFADTAFQNAVCRELGKPNGTLLYQSDVNTMTRLDVNDYGITDMTGIENFTSLQFLLCSKNKLTKLDVSKNTALTYLTCYDNQLKTLDVSNNTELKYLYVSRNLMTGIDVTNNVNLMLLEVIGNYFPSRDAVIGLRPTTTLFFDTQNAPLEYTVTFDINGGTVMNTIAPIAVKSGEKVTQPKSSPGFVNHIFVGWYDEDNNPFDFNTPITKDITLKAKWLPRAFASSASGNVIQKGDTIILSVHSCAYCDADSVKIYYALNGGWIEYTEPVVINAFPYNYNDDNGDFCRIYVETRAYGKTNNTGFVYGEMYYEAAKYNVVFDGNGGAAVDSAAVYEGEKVARPADPTREGYTFAGWLLGDAEFNFNSEITSNITLTAKWEKEPEKVTLLTATPSASVDKLNGNQNRLNITVTEKYSDGNEKTITWSGMISNNAAGTYDVGGYKVYVDTKGNNQIRACYVVE